MDMLDTPPAAACMDVHLAIRTHIIHCPLHVTGSKRIWLHSLKKLARVRSDAPGFSHHILPPDNQLNSQTAKAISARGSPYPEGCFDRGVCYPAIFDSQLEIHEGLQAAGLRDRCRA
eukprot:scaffold91373_cov19-Tisochrysis_lutea.AAC.2